MSFAMSRRSGILQPPLLVHPLHLFLLAGATCFFISGFVSDWLYFTTHEIQWKNFASWLIFGGLILGGFALLWALADAARSEHLRTRRLIYFALLLGAWVLSFVNELIHAKDAWASMPEALILSGVVAVLSAAACWLGFALAASTGEAP